VETYFLSAREVVTATPRTRIITIDLDTQAFTFRAGQAVLAGRADGALKRPYSIACSPGQARRSNAIELLVQTDDHRVPDPHLERVTAGTALRIEGPFGSFGLSQPLTEPRLLLIAGGTGIAPLRAILWDTLEHRAAVDIHLIYSARSPGAQGTSSCRSPPPGRRMTGGQARAAVSTARSFSRRWNRARRARSCVVRLDSWPTW
jgi:ferredoxin-NADP reductase